MKVSFDYDGTLTREMVQLYAAELVRRGVEVWICTFRYDDEHKKQQHKTLNNKEIFTLASKIGIKKDHIIFTNYQQKWGFLKDRDFVWHLDDDPNMLQNIADNTDIGVVYVELPAWMGKCERLLAKNKLTKLNNEKDQRSN